MRIKYIKKVLIFYGKGIKMRCYTCTKFSISIICELCVKNLFKIDTSTRKVGTIDVISFYKYSAIESLLLSKHKPEGYRIYKKLSTLTVKPFIEEFVESDDRMIYIVGVDEYVKSGYSHVALLTRAMKTKTSKPLHASLMAKNRVHYSGKDLQYRLNNPRDFMYTGKSNIDVILIDDIITTGITLQEAQNVLMENGVNVLFALTLANVDED